MYVSHAQVLILYSGTRSLPWSTHLEGQEAPFGERASRAGASFSVIGCMHVEQYSKVSSAWRTAVHATDTGSRSGGGVS